MTTKQKRHATMWDYGYEADGSDIEVDVLDLPDNIQKEFKRIFEDATNLDEFTF
jgi:hypothetical protein